LHVEENPREHIRAHRLSVIGLADPRAVAEDAVLAAAVEEDGA